jgi:hypothetical protein
MKNSKNILQISITYGIIFSIHIALMASTKHNIVDFNIKLKNV